MLNPSPSATITSPNPNVATANAPHDDSLVIVHHCPAATNTSTCPNIVHETWFVYPDSSMTPADGSATGWTIYNQAFVEVGSLLITQKNGNTINAANSACRFT
jgi:hypothetical protein